MTDTLTPTSDSPSTIRATSPWSRVGPPVLILAAGLLLRAYQIGQLSFWYDEVVTMRLARAGSVSTLLDLLFQIDATRAPLHPLLLHAWVGLFGQSEAAARSLSLLCGLLTIIVVADLGKTLFDRSAGLCAAWLAALSPLLIVYSREARMYAWLVLVTCLAWRQLLALQHGWSFPRVATYVAVAALLIYSHPLGLVMVATLALAGLLWYRALFCTLGHWLATHLAIAVTVLPWVRFYFDHPAEFLSGPLPVRFLLGTPIAFVGGNFLVLGLLALLIIFGIVRWLMPPRVSTTTPDDLARHRLAFGCLLLWLVVPPTTLYGYSLWFQPIFGPARYSVFVAPPYLILIAAGASRLPAPLRYLAIAAITALSLWSSGPTVFAPGLKADWRSFSQSLAQVSADSTPQPIVVMVASADRGRNVEVETARYYLPPAVSIIPLDATAPSALAQHQNARLFLATGTPASLTRDLTPPEPVGAYHFRPHSRYPGLLIYEGLR